MTLQTTQRLSSGFLFRWKHVGAIALTLFGISVVFNFILAAQLLLESSGTFSVNGLDTRLLGGAALLMLSLLLALHFYQQKRIVELKLEFMKSQSEGLRLEVELAKAGQSEIRH